MKKVVKIAAIVFVLLGIIFSFCACSQKGRLDSESANYSVYEKTVGRKTEYQYEIYDNDKNMIDSGDVSNYSPEISYISDDLLKVSLSYGTNARLATYYNLKTGQISEEFSNPIIENEKIVAFFSIQDDTKKLIIQEIFGEKHSEYAVDYSGAYGQVKDAEILDGNTLKLTYVAGDDYMTTTEYFDIVV